MKNTLLLALTILVNALFAQNNARFISQTLPENILPGQSFEGSITFENTGTTTWTPANHYSLGTQAPQDNTIWMETNRVALPNDVEPGQQVTFHVTLTAPENEGMYVIQWRMVQDGVEWFGEFSEAVYVPVTNQAGDTLLGEGNPFSVGSHIVATSFFGWYGEGEWQLNGPWIPVNGRASWDGSVDFWKTMIKEVMFANIDVLYIELIPVMEQSRGNLFIALSQLRAQGWNVPKVCPFLDPEITYSMLGFHADCSTEEGKDELIGHYIDFYKEYYSVNTDRYADDFIYTQDGHPVLDIWHIQLHIDHYNLLTRDDVTSRLAAAFGGEHPVFNNDIKMINNAYSPAFGFADERIYQFEMQRYKIDKNWKGINSSLLKPGYWDQNVRNPGFHLVRDGGSHYAHSWDEVNSDTTIDRVCIESFNEYDEGSGIFAAKTDTIFKKTDGGMNNTGNDVWSSTNDPFEYLKTTALGAGQFNDNPQLNAKILWDNFPETMNSGDVFTATVVVRNEGDELWNGANGFKFCEMDNLDTTLFNTGCYLINDTADEIPVYGGIFRGRAKTFQVEIKAPDTPGAYTIHWSMLKESSGWFGDTLAKNISVRSSDFIKTDPAPDFRIYPNPTNTCLQIESDGLIIENVEILDVNGKRCIANFNIRNNRIDISNLKKGVYFVRIGSVVKKFVKQ